MYEHNDEPKGRVVSIDLLIARYIRAVDQNDFETLDQLYELALTDPDLNALLMQTADALYEEGDIPEQDEPHVHEQHVRMLFLRNMPSAALDTEMVEQPITVGEVAQILAAEHNKGKRLAPADQAANTKLLGSTMSLPSQITLTMLRPIINRLDIQASDRYWFLFQQAAVTMCVTRERSRVQLVAARRASKSRRGFTKDTGTTQSPGGEL